MGADAILIGSRMVVAEEIWAHLSYKEHVLGIDENANRVVMKTFTQPSPCAGQRNLEGGRATRNCRA
jgi:nitronate monooxygenase